jgi:hypothetical protein
MQSEVYLWGSGGGACEIRHLIEDLNRAGTGHEIKGIVGSGPQPEFEGLRDLVYVDTAQTGWQSTIDPLAGAVVTAGSPELRATMWAEIEAIGLSRPILINPTAVVAATARL